jgi:hypothetical protein
MIGSLRQSIHTVTIGMINSTRSVGGLAAGILGETPMHHTELSVVTS